MTTEEAVKVPVVFEGEIDSQRFLDVLRMIKTTAEETVLQVSNDGIQVKQMDPAHIDLILVDVRPSEFIDLSFQGPTGSYGVGVSVEEILKLIDKPEKGSKYDLSFNSLKGTLRITEEFAEGSTRDLEVKTLEISREDFKTPELSYDAYALMETKDLLKAVKGASAVTDHVEITTGDERGILTLQAKGEVGTKTYRLKALDSAGFPGCRSIYSQAYLERFLSEAAKVTEAVRLMFSMNKPLEMRFEIPRAGSIVIRWMLAPRLEYEEEKPKTEATEEAKTEGTQEAAPTQS